MSRTTSAPFCARRTVIEVHDHLGEMIVAHGFVPGTVEISVLSIEAPATV